MADLDDALDVLRPFALALKSARHVLGEFPDRNDVLALALRRITHDDLNAALGFYAMSQKERD